MQDQDQEERILQVIEALVAIEMIATGQAKALAGKSDAERLKVIADLARDARRRISGDDALDLRHGGIGA